MADNQVRRRGLLYVLVPELHADGAVHFHGFFNGALPVVDSGTLDTGGKPRKPRSAAERARLIDSGAHIVYNLPAWTLGFTTAIELYGDYEAALDTCASTSARRGRRWAVGGTTPAGRSSGPRRAFSMWTMRISWRYRDLGVYR